MNLVFKTALPGDAGALSEMICANAMQTLAPYYNDQQRQAFLDEYAPVKMVRKIQTQDLYIALANDRLAGTVALKDDWVVGVYTAIDFMGQGIGKKLMEFIEGIALQKGFKSLRLAASPLGVAFYSKLGWETIALQQFDYEGVLFEETLMTKRLRG